MPLSDAVDGFRLAYDDHDARAADAAAVVLLHGWPGDRHDYRAVVPLLTDRCRVLVPDLRGFGETGKTDPGPTDAMTVDVLAEDMLAFLDALGLDRSVGFVSHDVGAYVTQALVRRGPPVCFSSTALTPASAGAGPSRSI